MEERGARKETKNNLSDEPTSLSSLIEWNISKALEMNPYIDLKNAMKAAQERMEQDVEAMVHQFPEERHLACALLAWQQLGHSDADSLYKFLQSKKIEEECTCKKDHLKNASVSKDKTPNSNVSCSLQKNSQGPVIKLPAGTKIVMRMDSTHQNPRRRQKGQDKDTTSKIDAACCLDSACAERLALVDAATTELRDRANKLAKREAERVELLERAEIAWRDLETGYQRRLRLAQEKEEDIANEIEKLIEERNSYKNACIKLVQQLKDKGDAAEKDKNKLMDIEKQVCAQACVKLRLSEDCARAEATLAEHQCRAAQLDRDLQFKEEQTLRKKTALESEQESARALSIEAERAMRAELSALREQIKQVSNDLLQEDGDNERIKEELDQLREEKMEIVEDLEGCKETCDARMQGRFDELKKKREQLAELKDKAMECRCKLPVDETVEVKRTASLAALCRCSPDDKLVESCSCTSLRERLLSNLLADLFAGLQAELGGTGAQMPCQLLKCLEDKHNWDRASVVKNNLRHFFSKLLIGELDIAITTSIEKYHAKWVGASCADDVKKIQSRSDDQNDGWEERAIERKAQKLATKLAEQLFEERAEQLAERAKAIAKAGTPPCECNKPTQAFPCLVKTTITPGVEYSAANVTGTRNTGFWKRTQQDVTELKLQIESLKKDSINKQDLKLMEQKIAKIVQQASAAEQKEQTAITRDNTNTREIPKDITKKEKNTNHSKSGNIIKRKIETNSLKKTVKTPLNHSQLNEKNSRQYKQFAPAYAVNLCLCGPQNESKPKVKQAEVQPDSVYNEQIMNTWKQRISKDNVSQISSIKQTKPINPNFPTPKFEMSSSKSSAQPWCRSDCICFHKRPSNTSIDKLLETLTKWKYDLVGTREKSTTKTICKQNVSNFKNKLIKRSSLKGQNISELSNINKSMLILTSSIGNKVQNITDSELDRILLPPTESEYMGAINLDKSNEHFCKCVKSNKIEIKNKMKSNSTKGSNMMCISSDLGDYKRTTVIKPDSKPPIDDEKPFHDVHLSENPQLKDTVILDDKNDPGSPKNLNNENKETLHRNEISKKSEIFPGQCDYFVKFLGVTLTNANSQNLSKDLNDSFIDNNADHSKNTRYAEDHGKKMENNHFEKSSKPGNISNRNNNHGDDFIKHETSKITNQIADNISNEHCLGFRTLKSTHETCVCCNYSNMDNSKDLEVNVFHLLEDHLKGKLEEFKSISCKSSCIPSHEEEKLFADIMQKVKQVISDCANDMKCKCPGENDGSWNRAYGLLQEYLKIKIQRVQCLCVSLNDGKNIALGNILDKVCNLIENDFERLKQICQCKIGSDTRKNIQIENKAKSIEEIPEKDVNIPNYEIVIKNINPVMDKLSNLNSKKPISFTENISSQVYPNLGMETKSCDIISIKTKNFQTTETNTIYPDSYSKIPEVNTIDCDCDMIAQNDAPFLELYGAKKVLVSICADTVKNTDETSSFPVNILESPPLQFDKEKCILKSQHEIDCNENKHDIQTTDVQQKCSLTLPYIGYTVDCTCNASLGPCVCMKSVVQANKKNNTWNTFMTKNANHNQDLSYIMNSVQNNTSNNSVIDTTPPPALIEINGKRQCEMQINTKNEEDIVLLDARDEVNITHNTTNTLEEHVSLSTECSNTDWSECSQGVKPEIKCSKDILHNLIYFPFSSDYVKRFKSETQMNGAKYENSDQKKCECDVVPICHVKMLVENIEHNLIHSKCTCDSMTAKVCPVHSERF